MAQLCLSLCDPIDCSQPASSVHRILQAIILEWVAMPFFRESSLPRDWTCISCIGRHIFYHRATWEAQPWYRGHFKKKQKERERNRNRDRVRCFWLMQTFNPWPRSHHYLVLNNRTNQRDSKQPTGICGPSTITVMLMEQKAGEFKHRVCYTLCLSFYTPPI